MKTCKLSQDHSSNSFDDPSGAGTMDRWSPSADQYHPNGQYPGMDMADMEFNNGDGIMYYDEYGQPIDMNPAGGPISPHDDDRLVI